MLTKRDRGNHGSPLPPSFPYLTPAAFFEDMIKRKAGGSLLDEPQSPTKRPKLPKKNRQPVSLEPVGNGTDRRPVGLHDLPVEVRRDNLVYVDLFLKISLSFSMKSFYSPSTLLSL